MTKNTKIVLSLLLLCVAIVLYPLLTNHESDFAGADGLGKDAISEIAPDYVPWAHSLIAPPGTETESLIFSLQAAFGSGILFFGFGYLIARKKYGGKAAEAVKDEASADKK